MLVFERFLQQDWVTSLGWMLLHSLWQHTVIALCCMLFLFSMRQFNASARYFIALGCLIIYILISAITFIRYQHASTAIVIKPEQQSVTSTLFADSNIIHWLGAIHGYVSSLTLIWMVGVLIYSLKIFFDYRACQHLKNQCLTATPTRWQEIFTDLAAKVGISTRIELRISLIAMCPCVIGHLKPVVLLPMRLLLGFSQQQIEVILLHELAHVRRNDYLVGFVQTIIKAAFFFNPFLLWISSQMDKEREHSCDDVAITVSQNPILFANTLKELAEMNNNQKMTMNIAGKKFLLARIVRVFNKQKELPASGANVVASALILFASSILTVYVNAASENSIDTKTISMDVTNTPVQSVMAEVNKKCATNEVLPTKNNGEITLVLEDITCRKAIQLLKDFAGEKPTQE